MLTISAGSSLLDLPPDISLTLESENPLFSSDRIPTTYSLEFEVRGTSHNLDLFSHPERLGSAADFTTKIPSEIRFDTLLISSGALTVTTVTSEGITLSFRGAVLPRDIRRHLQNQNLGRKVIGTAHVEYNHVDTSELRISYNDHLTELAAATFPDIVAAPVYLSDAKEPPYDGPSHAGLRERIMWINPYLRAEGFSSSDGYLKGALDFGTPILAKILPAVRVGYILRCLLGTSLESNVFDTTEWQRLMLISSYHPRYTTRDSTPVWDIDTESLEVSISLADFMPSVAANEFLSEILKLPCASMYISGDRYTIELNRDTLSRPCRLSWDDRLIGTPEISRQAAQRYTYGYSGDSSSAVSPEIEITPVDTIHAMYLQSERDDIPPARTYRVAKPSLVIESSLAPHGLNRCRFKTLEQDLGGNNSYDDASSVEGGDDVDDNESPLDMTFRGTLPVMSLQAYPAAGSDDSRFLQLVPTLACDDSRPDSLTVALYHGMRGCLSDQLNCKYPYLSPFACDLYGAPLTTFSLCFRGPDGLFERYHAPLAAWARRDRRTLRNLAKLSALDLHNFDFRDKVSVSNRDFFLRKLSYTLHLNHISPADCEFIEA